MATQEENRVRVGGECVIGEKKHNSRWVAVDVEKMLEDDNPHWRMMEAEQWKAQYIYRVPVWLKGTNGKAYQPQLVSLGPFHHGDPNLLPMEEHKCRALVHLINRSQKPIQDFISAIDDVVEDLMAAYGKDLHVEWRNDRRSFIDMMLRDGCFLLEMMSGSTFPDYKPHDPVFSWSGRRRIYCIIRSDMLLIENQLPLLVLKKILGVVCPDYPEAEMDTDIALMVLECLGRAHEDVDIVEVLESLHEVALDKTINHMVQRFLGRAHVRMANMLTLRHHPLQLYHESITCDCEEGARGDAVTEKSQEYKHETMPSALEIHEAGIKFRKTKRDNLRDIEFKGGVLSMPKLKVVDSTESLYLNLMAFERLHVGAGNLVTAYVICMDDMIVSKKDVAMLRSNGVLVNMLGCDEETAKLFNGTLNRGQILSRCHDLHKVQYDVKAYCNEPWHKWRATLMRTHFRNPWAFVSLAAAAILLIATLLQTAYTIMPNKS